ncbi:MAG: hypothetical protein ABW151_06525, partial [Pseudorhodoplanes sp.]
MTGITTADAHAFGAARPSFATKLLYGIAGMALLSLGVSVGGKWLGRELALAGHTEDSTLHDIVIGEDIISAPANMIRFDRQRRDGAADRLDLYLRWPALQGYSQAASDDFNHANGSRTLIFLSFEPRVMSLPMSGRLDAVYAPMLLSPATEGPGGTTVQALDPKAGYLNETLVVGREIDGGEPFVARCLDEDSGESQL